MKIALVLTAAGTSERFASGKKKEYMPLCSALFPNPKSGTVLSCSAEPFLLVLPSGSDCTLTRFIVTLPPRKADKAEAEQALFASPFVAEKLRNLHLKPEFIPGGASRRESVFCALEHIAAGCQSDCDIDLVFIHDAARPFVSPGLVKKVLSFAREKGACAPALPVVDTCKEIDTETLAITRHLPRSRLAAVQTPQCFYFKKLLEAHRKAHEDGKTYTDDTEIWGAYEGDVYVCEGERTNVKITYKEDLPGGTNASRTPASCAVYRTGLGSDTHRLVSGRPLLIGGVHIPFNKGELAHSDGDVLFHAITDALLGAASLGDIGELFPPSDPAWKDADSALLLKTAWRRVLDAGWRLENLDCVLSIERPKILDWRHKIRESIASALGCEIDRVFVKAKTAEGLGDIGEGKAVSALCTCLLRHAT